MSCCSTCFNAAVNPEGQSVPVPTSTKEIKQKCTSDSTASESNNTLEALQSPLKLRCGWPPTKTKALDNLEDMQLIISMSTKEIEQKHTTDNKISEANNTLEALQSLPKPKHGRPSTKMKRKHTADDTADEGDNTPEGPQSPLKEKSGWPPVKKKAAEIVAPKAGKPASGYARTGDPKPLVWRGKVLLPRSPQAGWTNQNTHPGIIATLKPKRTKAEVAAAIKCKADL
jgi:hypothetical protein